MRHFQLMLLAMLAVISVELGLLVIKLPTPVAQAGPSTINAPATGLQDPHDVLKAQLDRVEKEVAEVRRGVGAIQKDQASIQKDQASLAQQVTAVGNQAETILKYGHTWAWTCTWAGNLFGDLDPQRQKSIQGPKVSPCEIQTPVK